jgi:hypothetical protein
MIASSLTGQRRQGNENRGQVGLIEEVAMRQLQTREDPQPLPFREQVGGIALPAIGVRHD